LWVWWWGVWCVDVGGGGACVFVEECFKSHAKTMLAIDNEKLCKMRLAMDDYLLLHSRFFFFSSFAKLSPIGFCNGERRNLHRAFGKIFVLFIRVLFHVLIVLHFLIILSVLPRVCLFSLLMVTL